MNRKQPLTVTVNTVDREWNDLELVTSRRGIQAIGQRAAKAAQISLDEITSLVIVWVPDRTEK